MGACRSPITKETINSKHIFKGVLSIFLSFFLVGGGGKGKGDGKNFLEYTYFLTNMSIPLLLKVYMIRSNLGE